MPSTRRNHYSSVDLQQRFSLPTGGRVVSREYCVISPRPLIYAGMCERARLHVEAELKINERQCGCYRFTVIGSDGVADQYLPFFSPLRISKGTAARPCHCWQNGCRRLIFTREGLLGDEIYRRRDFYTAKAFAHACVDREHCPTPENARERLLRRALV